MKPKIDYNLYLVTDREVLKSRDIVSSVEEAILGGVTVVQIREKKCSSLDFYNIAVKVKNVTDKYNIPLIINDRVDIALAVDAAGVHIGQSDIPCPIARNILGNEKIIGVSTSKIEEAIKAEKDGADYIGVGAVFQTGTKLDAKSVDLETLKNIKNIVKIPVVAIGGIGINNCNQLIESNVNGIAVVSAILGKEDIITEARLLSNWRNK